MQTPPDPAPNAASLVPSDFWGRGRGRMIAAVGLLGLVGLAYGPSLRGGFVWDDLILVTKNPLATGELNLGSVWWSADFSLSTVVMWLEWLLFKDAAAGYRVVNLGLHGVSTLLFWQLLRQIRVRNAWAGAALFALHPIAVASVAWISELKNTLSLPFFLLSALWFLKWTASDQASSFNLETAGGSNREPREPREKNARRWYYAGSLVAFLFALLAKTSTVVLPAMLLLLGWGQNGKLTKRDLLRLTPHFALALLFGSLTIYFQTHQAIRDVQVQTENFPERLADAGIAAWFYLGKALLPVQLCAIYPGWKENFPGLLRYLPAVLLAAGLVGSWMFRATWGRPVLLTLGGFILMLFPVLGWFDMYFMIFARVSDHFAYLALLVVGASGAAVLAGIKPTPGLFQEGKVNIQHSTSNAQHPTVKDQPSPGPSQKEGAGPTAIANRQWPMAKGQLVIGALLLAGLTFLTRERAKVYASDEALWRDTVQKNPRAWNAHNNLACNFAERGDLEAAMKHFAISLELNPKNAQAHRNLGKALLLRGKFPEAEPHFRAALELLPTDTETMTTYAAGLAQVRRFAEGAELLQRADRLKPAVKTKQQLVPFLMATGEYATAILTLEEILTSQPQSYGDLNNLAWLLATCPDGKFRDGPRAVRLSETACKLTDYREPVLLGTLAAAHAEAGDFTNAVTVTKSAIEVTTAAGNEQLTQFHRQMLRLYQTGRPFHLTAPEKRSTKQAAE